MVSSTHASAAAILKKCTFVQQNLLLLVPHALEHGSTSYEGMAICRTGVHVKSTSQHHLWESSHLISTHEKNSLAVFSLTPQIVKNHNQILRNDRKNRKKWSNLFQFHTGRINTLKIKVFMYFWPPSTYCCAHLLAHAHDRMTLCQNRLAEHFRTYSPQTHVKVCSLSCAQAFS